jgi:HK97 family phage prohead protease
MLQPKPLDSKEEHPMTALIDIDGEYLDLSSPYLAGWEREPAFREMLTTGHRPIRYRDTGEIRLRSEVREQLSVKVPFAMNGNRSALSPSHCGHDCDCHSCSTLHGSSVAIGEHPDRAEMERALRGYFLHSRDRGTTCRPLGKWHPDGKPFIAGYAAVFDNLTCQRPSGHRLLLRQGMFTEVLASKKPVEAWINHKGAMKFASTTTGTLAIVQDQFGLAAFILPPDDANGLAIVDAVARGELAAMSLHFHSDGNTFQHGSERIREVTYADKLTEVSLCPEGCNPAAFAIAVNYRHGMETSGQLAARDYLKSRLQFA